MFGSHITVIQFSIGQLLGTLLDQEIFCIAVALRVGAKGCDPHKCRCGRLVDGLSGTSRTLMQVQRGTAPL